MLQNSGSSQTDNKFTVIKQLPESPDLNPTEDVWDVVEQNVELGVRNKVAGYLI